MTEFAAPHRPVRLTAPTASTQRVPSRRRTRTAREDSLHTAESPPQISPDQSAAVFPTTQTDRTPDPLARHEDMHQQSMHHAPLSIAGVNCWRSNAAAPIFLGHFPGIALPYVAHAMYNFTAWCILEEGS